MRTAKVTTQTLKAAMIKNVRNGRNGQISTCVQQLVEPDFRVRFKIKKKQDFIFIQVPAFKEP